MSPTDLTSTQREEAAAHAIFSAWREASHPAMRNRQQIDTWADEAAKLAQIALRAADEKVSPDSFGEYEGHIHHVPTLVEALRSLLGSFGSRVLHNPEPSRSATVSVRRLDLIAAVVIGGSRGTDLAELGGPAT